MNNLVISPAIFVDCSIVRENTQDTMLSAKWSVDFAVVFKNIYDTLLSANCAK
jgi:hypothetical protein